MSKQPIIILVLGATGQVGSEIKSIHQNYPQYKFIFADRSTIDISERGSLDKIKSLKPAFVINCAAYTAVDHAEKALVSSMISNAYAVGWIARGCAECGASLIHLSSDYVYHSNPGFPLRENDVVKPEGVYAMTKAAGEQLANYFCPRTIILRSSWIYSSYGNNFVKTMLKLALVRKEIAVVNDQFGAPTYAEDLASAILSIIKNIVEEGGDGKYGIYNYANEGLTSWYDFAKEIFQVSKIGIEVKGITTAEYGAAAPRPAWSVLSLSKIKQQFGLEIPYWRFSLAKCLQKIEETKV